MSSSSDTVSLFRALHAKLRDHWHALPDKPHETPELTLRMLWSLAADDAPSDRLTDDGALPPLSEDAAQRLTRFVDRRIEGVPLSYLTGRQHFMGLELLSSPEAMIPRQETEILGSKALACLRDLQRTRETVRVLDLCTGSGNLAVALAVHEAACVVFAADLSPEAVGLATRNAAMHGVSDRVTFSVGDLFAPFDAPEFFNSIDLIVCNPPYITSHRADMMDPEIREHEPRLAFDGGKLGVGVILRLLAEAPRFMHPESWLCFEVGAGQGPHMVKRMEKGVAYAAVDSIVDDDGVIRVVAARATGVPAAAEPPAVKPPPPPLPA